MRGKARRLLPCILAAVLSMSWVALPARGAEGLVVECEDFEFYDSHNLGGIPIGAVFCIGASGYYAANGLDVPGEWILLSVNVPVPGCYRSELAYQAAYDDDVNLRVRMIDAPEPDDEILVDYWLTGGWGFG